MQRKEEVGGGEGEGESFDDSLVYPVGIQLFSECPPLGCTEVDLFHFGHVLSVN